MAVVAQSSTGQSSCFLFNIVFDTKLRIMIDGGSEISPVPPISNELHVLWITQHFFQSFANNRLLRYGELQQPFAQSLNNSPWFSDIYLISTTSLRLKFSNYFRNSDNICHSRTCKLHLLKP